MGTKVKAAPKPVGQVLDDLVSNLGLGRKLREYEAVTRWDEIVGEHIARVATATRITDGTLFVSVKTGSWRNELMLRKRDVIAQLNAALGGNVVREIKFH
jgi:predicted nucleic acid-binding Zn ribbon protein